METKLSSFIDDINVKLDNHYKKLETKFCQSEEDMVSIQPLNEKTISSNSVASLTASLVAEQKEHEKELNLVLHNVPESTASGSSTRKQEDIAQINSILNEYVDVKPTINNAIQLGKRDTNKHCLLKITVGLTQEKITVLCNKLKLRKESNPAHIKRFLSLQITHHSNKKE